MGITCAYPTQDVDQIDGKLSEAEEPVILTPRPGGVKKEVLFIWNLDIFTTLMLESCDENDRETFREKLDALLVDIAENHFSYRDLKNFPMLDIYDNPYIATGQDTRSSLQDSIPVEDVPNYNKLVTLNRKTKETFCKKCKGNLEDLISEDEEQQWFVIKQNIDALKDKCFTEAANALQIIKARSSCVNILLTTGHLIPALPYVIMMDLGQIFTIDNIYSTAGIGKEKCLENICKQFGGESNVFMFGVDKEDEKIAEKLKMAYWKVADQSDVDSLHHALTLNYL